MSFLIHNSKSNNRLQKFKQLQYKICTKLSGFMKSNFQRRPIQKEEVVSNLLAQNG